MQACTSEPDAASRRRRVRPRGCQLLASLRRQGHALQLLLHNLELFGVKPLYFLHVALVPREDVHVPRPADLLGRTLPLAQGLQVLVDHLDPVNDSANLLVAAPQPVSGQHAPGLVQAPDVVPVQAVRAPREGCFQRHRLDEGEHHLHEVCVPVAAPGVRRGELAHGHARLASLVHDTVEPLHGDVRRRHDGRAKDQRVGPARLHHQRLEARAHVEVRVLVQQPKPLVVRDVGPVGHVGAQEPVVRKLHLVAGLLGRVGHATSVPLGGLGRVHPEALVVVVVHQVDVHFEGRAGGLRPSRLLADEVDVVPHQLDGARLAAHCPEKQHPARLRCLVEGSRI
mmetsp:Transcript_123473/g.384320  ORF Transcript_123473/g.384320 Transcript_123473/m.384320 type:complete len:340 (+) Transcript_123473:167-1186(+)